MAREVPQWQQTTAGVRTAIYGKNATKRAVCDVNAVALPAIAGGASLAVGRELFTIDHDGPVKIVGSSIDVSIKQTEGNIDSDTPDLGLGTTIASGAVAVLSGTAAFENVMTGQTMDDCDGTAETTAVATELLIQASGDKTVYLNVADGWAASGDAGALLHGEVVVSYVEL